MFGSKEKTQDADVLKNSQKVIAATLKANEERKRLEKENKNNPDTSWLKKLFF